MLSFDLAGSTLTRFFSIVGVICCAASIFLYLSWKQLHLEAVQEHTALHGLEVAITKQLRCIHWQHREPQNTPSPELECFRSEAAMKPLAAESKLDLEKRQGDLLAQRDEGWRKWQAALAGSDAVTAEKGRVHDVALCGFGIGLGVILGSVVFEINRRPIRRFFRRGSEIVKRFIVRIFRWLIARKGAQPPTSGDTTADAPRPT